MGFQDINSKYDLNCNVDI